MAECGPRKLDEFGPRKLDEIGPRKLDEICPRKLDDLSSENWSPVFRVQARSKQVVGCRNVFGRFSGQFSGQFSEQFSGQFSEQFSGQFSGGPSVQEFEIRDRGCQVFADPTKKHATGPADFESAAWWGRRRNFARR